MKRKLTETDILTETEILTEKDIPKKECQLCSIKRSTTWPRLKLKQICNYSRASRNFCSKTLFSRNKPQKTQNLNFRKTHKWSRRMCQNKRGKLLQLNILRWWGVSKPVQASLRVITSKMESKKLCFKEQRSNLKLPSLKRRRWTRERVHSIQRLWMRRTCKRRLVGKRSIHSAGMNSMRVLHV